MARLPITGWSLIGLETFMAQPFTGAITTTELSTSSRRDYAEALWETAKAETTLRNAQDAGRRLSASRSQRKPRQRNNALRLQRLIARLCRGFPARSTHRRCNDANIDAGVVNVVSGFASLKPAEFIILKISIKAKPPC